MPGFRSRSQNALPFWLADDDGNPISLGGTGANAPQSQPVDSTGAPQFGPSGKAAVTGTFTVAGLAAAVAATQPYRSGVFSASVGRAIWATLRYVANATGTVTVLRSVDGTNYYPLTVGGSLYAAFTASCQEPVSSEDDSGVTYLFECTATNNTITYRLGHS